MERCSRAQASPKMAALCVAAGTDKLGRIFEMSFRALVEAEIVIIGNRAIDRAVLSRRFPQQAVIQLVKLGKFRRTGHNDLHEGTLLITRR